MTTSIVRDQGSQLGDAHSRRAILQGAGRLAAAVTVGAVAGSHAFVPARTRAASAATILFTTYGATCEASTFVAQEKGYFKDEGLDVTLAGAANSGEGFTRLAKGAADAGSYPAWALVPKWLPTGVQLGDVVATAGLQRGCFSLLVAKDSPYQILADLKGQKIAAGPSLRFIFGEPLAQAGLNPLTDIDWQPGLPWSGVAAALANKDVAAAPALEPLPATLLATGAARALVVQDMPPMMMDYCCSVVVPGALLRADRSKATAITRAMMRGSAWAAAHPTETAQLEVTGKYVSATLTDNQNAIAKIAFVPSVSAAQANLRDMLGRMVKLGFLDPATDVPALNDQIFVPITAELPGSGATTLPQTGGLPPAVTLGGGLALLGLGLLAKRVRRTG
jgi:NitT/TauT family transport system substrate-binding protein